LSDGQFWYLINLMLMQAKTNIQKDGHYLQLNAAGTDAVEVVPDATTSRITVRMDSLFHGVID